MGRVFDIECGVYKGSKVKSLREILEELICKENGLPLGTPMDDIENMNIDQGQTPGSFI